jgi:exopolysaccharide biosynthesis polyprenyl glycosylphosphotransferase
VSIVDARRPEAPHDLPLGNALARRIPRTGGSAPSLAAFGRASLIWLPVYVLLTDELPTVAALASASFVTGAWLLALRTALSTYFTLGPATASAVGTFTGLLTVSAVELWVPGVDFGARSLAATAVAVFLLSAVWEHVVRMVAKRRVLIVGTSECASAVAEELAHDEDAPFTVVGVVDEEPGGGVEVPRLGSVVELNRIVAAQKPDIVVLADAGSHGALDRLLEETAPRFRVVSVPHFFEHAFGRVPLPYLTPAWFMSMLHLRQKPYTRIAKRTFDVVAASAGLVLAAPLLAVLAPLVAMTPGPLIYRQTRVGEAGRLFTIYKLRTMCHDAEGRGEARFAEEHDPRVTAVGHVLRRTHLDELPQLWNVLKGDMSIVGPRPERPEFVAMLERAVPFWTRRLNVRPGITGWAQVCGGYAFDPESTADKLSYDLWYLRHRDLVVDLAICARTLTTLLARPGR